MEVFQIYNVVQLPSIGEMNFVQLDGRAIKNLKLFEKVFFGEPVSNEATISKITAYGFELEQLNAVMTGSITIASKSDIPDTITVLFQ